MIIGNLTNIEKEIELYPRAIQQGLDFLIKQDLTNLALGEYKIKENLIFAKIAAYETQPVKQRRPERHAKYIDIQCIVAGVERIDSAPLEAAGEIDENKMDERDVLYYKDMQAEVSLVLAQGMFAIYFPWDLHRPNCNAGQQSVSVKKAIVKIAMSELAAKPF